MKTIFWIIINILIWFLIILLISQIGIIWKLFGGSFINGNEIVYKGKVLATAHDDCMFSWTEGFTNVEMFCPKTGIKSTWLNGELQIDSLENK